jgi:hypothetical protein
MLTINKVEMMERGKNISCKERPPQKPSKQLPPVAMDKTVRHTAHLVSAKNKASARVYACWREPSCKPAGHHMEEDSRALGLLVDVDHCLEINHGGQQGQPNRRWMDGGPRPPPSRGWTTDVWG